MFGTTKGICADRPSLVRLARILTRYVALAEQERRERWHTMNRHWLLWIETMVILDDWATVCAEKIPLKPFPLMTMLSRGCWVSQHIDFHWKSVQLTVERCTVSLHCYKLFLCPRHTSPTLMAECRMTSVTTWADTEEENVSIWWLALQRSCLKSTF